MTELVGHAHQLDDPLLTTGYRTALLRLVSELNDQGGGAAAAAAAAGQGQGGLPPGPGRTPSHLMWLDSERGGSRASVVSSTGANAGWSSAVADALGNVSTSSPNPTFGSTAQGGRTMRGTFTEMFTPSANRRPSFTQGGGIPDSAGRATPTPPTPPPPPPPPPPGTASPMMMMTAGSPRAPFSPAQGRGREGFSDPSSSSEDGLAAGGPSGIQLNLVRSGGGAAPSQTQASAASAGAGGGGGAGGRRNTWNMGGVTPTFDAAGAVVGGGGGNTRRGSGVVSPSSSVMASGGMPSPTSTRRRSRALTSADPLAEEPSNMNPTSVAALYAADSAAQALLVSEILAAATSLPPASGLTLVGVPTVAAARPLRLPASRHPVPFPTTTSPASGNSSGGSKFLYNPAAARSKRLHRSQHQTSVLWVAGEPAAVSLRLGNPLSVPLEIQALSLVAEDEGPEARGSGGGGGGEGGLGGSSPLMTFPLALTIPPHVRPHEAPVVTLTVKPLRPGQLRIRGLSIRALNITTLVELQQDATPHAVPRLLQYGGRGGGGCSRPRASGGGTEASGARKRSTTATASTPNETHSLGADGTEAEAATTSVTVAPPMPLLLPCTPGGDMTTAAGSATAVTSLADTPALAHAATHTEVSVLPLEECVHVVHLRNRSHEAVRWLQVWATGKTNTGSSAGTSCLLARDMDRVGQSGGDALGGGGGGGSSPVPFVQAPSLVERAVKGLGLSRDDQKSSINLPVEFGETLAIPIAFRAVPGLESIEFSIAYAAGSEEGGGSAKGSDRATEDGSDTPASGRFMRHVVVSAKLVPSQALRAMCLEVLTGAKP